MTVEEYDETDVSNPPLDKLQGRLITWLLGFFLIGTACSGSIFPVVFFLVQALTSFNIFIPIVIWFPITFAGFLHLTLYWGAMYYQDIKKIINNPKEWGLPPSNTPGFYPALLLGVLNSLFVGNFSTAFGGMNFISMMGLHNPVALTWSWGLYLCSGIISCASFSLRTAVNFYTKIFNPQNNQKTQYSSFFETSSHLLGCFLYGISSAIFAFISSLTTFQLFSSGSSLSQFSTVQNQVLNNLKSMPKSSKFFGLFGFIINFLISIPFSDQEQPKQTTSAPTSWRLHLGNFASTLLNTSMMVFFTLIESSPLALLGLNIHFRLLFAIPLTAALSYYSFFQLFNLSKETLLLPLKDLMNFKWHEWVDTFVVLTFIMSSWTFSGPTAFIITLILSELINAPDLWLMISNPMTHFQPLKLIDAVFVPHGIEKLSLSLINKATYTSLPEKLYRLSMRFLTYTSTSLIFHQSLGSAVPILSSTLTVFAPNIINSFTLPLHSNVNYKKSDLKNT
ncbi:MAG TPA: hypothetical protein QF353_02525 [Gammaproteobacteria bacterium]|nr:hypothetical protein [Gammaproteobacteria bacterium]